MYSLVRIYNRAGEVLGGTTLEPFSNAEIVWLQEHLYQVPFLNTEDHSFARGIYHKLKDARAKFAAGNWSPPFPYTVPIPGYPGIGLRSFGYGQAYSVFLFKGNRSKRVYTFLPRSDAHVLDEEVVKRFLRHIGAQ